jgi:hypothetical protein
MYNMIQIEIVYGMSWTFLKYLFIYLFFTFFIFIVRIFKTITINLHMLCTHIYFLLSLLFFFFSRAYYTNLLRAYWNVRFGGLKVHLTLKKFV